MSSRNGQTEYQPNQDFSDKVRSYAHRLHYQVVLLENCARAVAILAGVSLAGAGAYAFVEGRYFNGCACEAGFVLVAIYLRRIGRYRR